MNDQKTEILGFDLGASNGRAILGSLTQNKLIIEEIYRFPNHAISMNDSLYWDILYLFHQIKNGLKEYVNQYGGDLSSVGVDTWGVDFILLDKKNEIIGPVHHYRDKRTEGIMEEMVNVVSKQEIFQQTGIQFLDINSSNQLFSMVKQKSPRLQITGSFLMLPDYFHYLLSGVKATEFSNATTTQLFNPKTKTWAFDLINKLGFKSQWFQNIISGGTILGDLNEAISKETRIGSDTKIIAPLTHDTGSAYVAAPVEADKYEMGEYGILSSGTWGLLGVELDEPLINEKAFQYNYTNEGGFKGSIRFLKNITGMWLLQECKKLWMKEGKQLSWESISREAEKAEEFQSFINPDHSSFLNPNNMIDAIQIYCKKSNQSVPTTIGEIARTILESLALRYKQAVEMLEEIIGNKLKVLYIIGGGSNNSLLNQFTANILQIPIIAGPSEATAIGNILIQALALGKVKNIRELRRIVRNSFSIEKFQPKSERKKKWNEAYQEYLSIIKE
ncbi:MAG: rhamnulokinase [Promethearchaeia archaeon]